MSTEITSEWLDISISLAKFILEQRQLHREYHKTNPIDIINSWNYQTGKIISDSNLMKWALKQTSILCQTPLGVLSESVLMDNM